MPLNHAQISAASISARSAGASTAPSRFAFWGRPAAIATIALLVLAEAYGILNPRGSPPVVPEATMATPSAAAPKVHNADLLLYENIIRDLRDGQSYYAAAARELRGGDYPLRPFVAIRPPLLAELLALAPIPVALFALRILVAALFVVWAIRLRPALGLVPAVAMASLTFATLGGEVALLGETQYLPLHEMWAGLFVALSLALRTSERWIAAALVGALAALIRELAFPYVALMAAAAFYEGKRRETAGWIAVICLFAAATGYHAFAATAVVTATDRISPGWSHHGGWRFFLNVLWLAGPFRSAPYVVTAALTPLALLGWAGWRDGLAIRALAVIAGYGILLMVFARPDNFYWVLMIEALMPIGLAFAPRSLEDLVTRVRSKPPLPGPQP
jgi:hypothetical protein